MPNQPKNRQNDKGTIIYREYSTDEGDPYYPVPNEKNRALYRKYQDLALKEPNVIFVGRLASYKYFNMDEVCTFYNAQCSGKPLFFPVPILTKFWPPRISFVKTQQIRNKPSNFTNFLLYNQIILHKRGNRKVQKKHYFEHV